MTLEKTCVQFYINDARCPALQLTGRPVCVNGKALSVLRLGWALCLSRNMSSCFSFLKKKKKDDRILHVYALSYCRGKKK